MLNPRKYVKRLKTHIKSSPRVFLLYSVLRVLVICVLIRQLFEQNYEGVGVCALVLLLFLIPSFLEQQFEIEIPPLFEGIIYIFIFAAEILGEVDHFYVALPGWDTILHTINGFLAAAVGFSMIDLLNRHSKQIQLSPFYLAMVAFCFSMTIGVIWEFIECAGDLFFGQDMQKDFIVTYFNSVTLDPAHSQQVIHVRNITDTVIHTASGQTYTIEGGYLDIGILDTMKDLFVNFTGAICFSAFGYFYVKSRGKIQNRTATRLANGLIVRVARDQNTLREEEEFARISPLHTSQEDAARKEETAELHCTMDAPRGQSEN